MTVSKTGTTPTPFGFVGASQYQTDSDSGLQLLGHRYYDASIGRFLSADPAKSGTNWYAYCDNNPLRAIDPLGLSGWGDGYLQGVGNFLLGEIKGAIDDVWDFGLENSPLVDHFAPPSWHHPCMPVTVDDGGDECQNGGYDFGKTLSHAAQIAMMFVDGIFPGEEGPPRGWGSNLPAKEGGPPNGSLSDGQGNAGTIRHYDENGRATVDYDFGHDHGHGDPHAHDWDWNKKPSRQDGRPIRVGE